MRHARPKYAPPPVPPVVPPRLRTQSWELVEPPSIVGLRQLGLASETVGFDDAQYEGNLDGSEFFNMLSQSRQHEKEAFSKYKAPASISKEKIAFDYKHANRHSSSSDGLDIFQSAYEPKLVPLDIADQECHIQVGPP